MHVNWNSFSWSSYTGKASCYLWSLQEKCGDSFIYLRQILSENKNDSERKKGIVKWCMNNRLVKKEKKLQCVHCATATDLSAETRFLPSTGTFYHKQCCLIYFFYVTAKLRPLMLMARGSGWGVVTSHIKRPRVLFVVSVRGLKVVLCLLGSQPQNVHSRTSCDFF